MITKISSNRKGSVYFEFSNGASLSIIFGAGTYSDNHDNLNFDRKEAWESTTFEAMVHGEEQLVELFEEKYEDNPAAYIGVSYLPEMIALVDKYEPKNDPSVYEIKMPDYKKVKVYESQREWFEKDVLPKLKGDK